MVPAITMSNMVSAVPRNRFMYPSGRRCERLHLMNRPAGCHSPEHIGHALKRISGGTLIKSDQFVLRRMRQALGLQPMTAWNCRENRNSLS